MNNKIKVGSIFSVKVSSNEKIFGRVLFDVDDYLNKSKSEGNQNYFDVFKKCVLIETFGKVLNEFDKSIIGNIAVTSSFIPKDTFFDEDEWELTDQYYPILLEYISFPEVLRLINNKLYFCVGEVSMLTAFDEKFRDDIGVYPSFGTGYWETVATLDFANREDLIEDKEDIMEVYFKDSDLRELPEIRKQIYESLNENPDIPYHELALKHGFDLKRFYK